MSDIWVDRVFWADFIELYKNNPCLQNVKNKMYLDRNAINKAYEILLENLKKSLQKSLNTWSLKTLTIYARKELKKVEASKASGTGTVEVYEPSLWYYDLSFLKDSETPRPSVSNVQEVKEIYTVLHYCI